MSYELYAMSFDCLVLGRDLEFRNHFYKLSQRVDWDGQA